MARLSALVLLLFLSCAAWSAKIKHVVVLMEENRSFDHMFGYSKRTKRGLTGNETNPINETNPRDGVIRVGANASMVNECDPNHSLNATSYKIFGEQAFVHQNFTVPRMNGFVEFERDVDGHKNESFSHFCGVMQAFTPERLPVINALAEEFVLFDTFHASLPGPTWPNRMFFFSGTSAGLTATGPWYHDQIGRLFPQKTIFDQVSQAGGKWRVYYNDTPWEMFVETIAHHPEHTRPVTEFFEDARTGNLPDFSFINPRSGINLTLGQGSNDQHPDHDMAVGEMFYKDVYEALRAGPAWNETLFILTYDEHGGFYDHVKPPMNIPPPDDGEKSYPDKGFLFDRAGIRIPTILISPWLPKGLTVSDPPVHAKPAHNSIFELTSIISSTRKLLDVLRGVGPLTKRDAWAATFDYLFDLLPTPRTDCPMHLPDAPAPQPGALYREANAPLNELQQHIMTVHGELSGVGTPPLHIAKQRHVSKWLQKHYHIHRTRVGEWKASKNNTEFLLKVIPILYAVYPNKDKRVKTINWDWTVRGNMSAANGQPPYQTVSTTFTMNGTTNGSKIVKELCLDMGMFPQEGTTITTSLCFPSSDPGKNRDPSQHVVLMPDATLRPYANLSLCTTTHMWEGSATVRLQACDGSVNQHFGYHGKAPGESNDGAIYFGDCTTGIVVLARDSFVPHVLPPVGPPPSKEDVQRELFRGKTIYDAIERD